MASILVYLFLPVAGLILLWLRKEFFNKIIIYIDGFYLPISHPIFGREKSILNWAKGRLPQQWSASLTSISGGIADFWQDGSLLCTIINSAIPNACANPYRHWKKSPVHAQDVAQKYFGIIPIFNDSEFSSHINPYLEIKLLNYLYLMRKSICHLEKERILPGTISTKFIARGMGLYTAEQFQMAEFYVYSRCDNVSFFNIELVILGPYSTYFKSTILEYLLRESKIKNQRKGEASEKNISVQIEIEKDRVRVAYVAKKIGIHEICLSCNQEIVMGSPFYVNVIKYSEITKCEEKCKNKIQVNIKEDKETNYEIQETKTEENILNEKKTVNSILNNSPTLEISKYLKDLNNSQEKVNISSKSSTERDKIWDNCPDYFTKNNYLYFQKLVDSSFRKTCRITRAFPKFSQIRFPQFSSASPICRDHIVPEGRENSSLVERRKIFSRQEPLSISDSKDLHSSASEKENKEEAIKIETKTNKETNRKPLIVGTIPLITKEQKLITNEKGVKRLHDSKKRNLQKSVLEKKLFWESAFNESTSSHNKYLNSSKESESGLVNESITRSESDKVLTRLKHIDSLHLLRRRPSLTKSLSDLRRSERRRKVQSYRSVDENLNLCGKIKLEDRMKIYLENVRFVNGELVDEWVMFNKAFLWENYDRSIFRGERKSIK